MTTQEITALRRSGKLQEALEAAEAEFAKKANIYTVSALFWCLNDLAKTQEGEALDATFDRMASLYDHHCIGDELMQKALAAIFHRLQPNFKELKDALEKARAGQDITREYQAFAGIYRSGELAPSLYLDFGWLIYNALRQTPADNAHARKEMLGNYLALKLPAPSLLHSRMLKEAIKTELNTPMQFRIRDFMRLWGLENFHNEDWEQYRTDDGKMLPSLIEKLIGAYARELKTDGVAAPEEFCRLVDAALEMYPGSQNMPYFKATVLLSQGKNDEALAYYQRLILRFPSKFYLWYQASDLVEDIDIKIGLLGKALYCGAKEEFVGGVRLKLASLLAQKGLLPNARLELDRYRQTYEEKGWKLKPEFQQLYSQLTSVAPADSNQPLYREFGAKADEFIYASLPTVLAVKVGESQSDDRFHPGRRITTWMLRTDDSTARLKKPSRFGLDWRTPNGTAFDIKMLDDRIVWIQKHQDAVSLPWLKELSGVAAIRTDRHGRPYAIISGVYVGENLLRGVIDGEEIRILAAAQKDGRWIAIALLE